MCFPVVCQQCNKYSWKGCGRHVPELFKSIEKGKHCTCRPWPGVVIPQEDVVNMKMQPTQSTDPKSSPPTGKTDVKKA